MSWETDIVRILDEIRVIRETEWVEVFIKMTG